MSTPPRIDLSPLTYALSRLSQRFVGGEGILFGPGQPIQPAAKEPNPRQMQYPSSVNMVWQPRRDWPNLTPFETLRHLNRRHPLAALCVRVRAQHIMGLSGGVVAKDKKAAAAEQGTVDALNAMLAAPDGQTPRAVWLQQLVRDLMEIDAPTVYKEPTRGGGLAGLRVIDGSTIKPLLDDRGRVVAYQQVIYGMALSQYLGRRAADDEQELVGEYSPGELWYQPFNATVTDPYGRAPMEDLLTLAQTYLRKIDSDLTRFTDGNIPAALGVFDGGAGVNVDQVEAFERNFNLDIQGLTSRASRIKFVPFPIKVERMQELSEGGKYESDWEERNVKLVCAAYGVTPAEIGFTADVNRATADAAENTTYRIGIKPLALWLKTVLFDPIIQNDLGQPQLEWQWDFGESEDREAAARVDNIYFGAGAVSSDELRVMRYPDLEGKAPGQPQANPTTGQPQPDEKVISLVKRGDDEPADAPGRQRAERELLRIVGEAFIGQRSRLAAFLAEAANRTAAALNTFFGTELQPLVRALLPFYYGTLGAGAQEGTALLAVTSSWDAVNAAVLALARQEAETLAQQLNATTQAQAAQILADWIATGGELDALVDRLELLYPSARAEMIAVTEVTRLYAQGNLAAWRASDVVTGYSWETAADERVCPVCGPLQGQRFELDGGQVPPAHPRCRCWIVPEVD